eukprot:TRINITY_DN6933_c0_g1_i11.p1 TRINITY_DN6933_c0_g1~~TRINITY_DN6933_c0_g1_i11.p1  ORF type:complete len:266 (-),score=36.60 TRINITY_DN6933_c0_g1_i11:227-1024(-)
MMHKRFFDQRMTNAMQISCLQIDALLRGQLQDFNSEIDGLMQRIGNYERAPGQYNLTQAEIERRRNMVTPLKSSLDELQKKATVRNQKQNTNLFDENKVNSQRFNEVVDTKNMSNQEMLSMQNNMMKDQDDQLDVLLGTVGNIKKIGKNINEELDVHHKLLDDLDDGVSRNINKMEKTQGKLQDFMQKSSNCCLYSIILGELLLLVFLISMQGSTLTCTRNIHDIYIYIEREICTQHIQIYIYIQILIHTYMCEETPRSARHREQ